MILIETPESPTPPGAKPDWLVLPDGARLRTALWSTTVTPCRGTIVLAGGRTEFIEKYFEVIGLFLERGFSVATFDWRGQGLSERMLDDPRKGHIDRFATFDADFIAFMDRTVRPNLPGPYIGVGHSMGGNLMLRAAHNLPDTFDCVVLSAPMLGINVGGPVMERLTRGLVSLLCALGQEARYAPGSGPQAADEEPFEQNVVTSDPVRYRRQQAVIEKVPSVGLGGPTVGWVRAAFNSIDEVAAPAYLEKIRLPVLIFEAGEDKLVKGEAVRQAAARLSQGKCLTVEGSAHEILMERALYREFFWSAFDGFVDDVLGAAGSVSAHA